MSIVKPRKVTAIAAVALVSGTAMTGFVGTPASAVQGSCNIGGDPYVEGRKLPVILVHGITGNPEQWRVGNLEKRIDSINNAHIAQNFSYEDKGVIAGLPTEYDMLATRLANVIDCAARKSALNGGPGKVAVAGYSLGAALTHTAASKTVNGEEVSSKIGQVVTIGDPWQAPRMLATKLTIGIPAFRKGIPVHALAGNIVEKIFVDSTMVMRYSLDTDNTIYLDSATSAATTGEGGGETVIECGKSIIYSGFKRKVTPFGGDFCHHENLLKGSAAQGTILYYIMQAANRLKPASQNVAQVKQLSFNYGNNLMSRGNPKLADSEEWAFDDMAVWGPYPESAGHNEHGDFHVVYRDAWVGDSDPFLNQGSTTAAHVSDLKGEVPVKTIGGKTPSKAVYLYSNGTSKEYVWYFADKGLAVIAAGNYASGFENSGAYAAINSAKWK